MKSTAARVLHDNRLPREGEIRSQTIPHLIHELALDRATGWLTLTDRDVSKKIQFSEGLILFASSTDRDDRLNQILLKAGVLSLPDLMRALELALSTRDRLGEVMVRLKLMGADEVEKWVKTQVRSIVLSVFHWTRGQYAFQAKPVANESITLGMRGDLLLFEGVRGITSWARVYEEVGGLNTEYRTTRDAASIARDLPLLPGERALLELCDEPTSLAELCEASKLGDYELCRSVWALLILGALMKS
jgi:uncharacterized protein DUF4388